MNVLKVVRQERILNETYLSLEIKTEVTSSVV